MKKKLLLFLTLFIVSTMITPATAYKAYYSYNDSTGYSFATYSESGSADFRSTSASKDNGIMETYGSVVIGSGDMVMLVRSNFQYDKWPLETFTIQGYVKWGAGFNLKSEAAWWWDGYASIKVEIVLQVLNEWTTIEVDSQTVLFEETNGVGIESFVIPQHYDHFYGLGGILYSDGLHFLGLRVTVHLFGPASAYGHDLVFYPTLEVDVDRMSIWVL